MIGLTKTIIYLLVISGAITSGLWYRKRQVKAMGFLTAFLIISFISELIAMFLSLMHGNNMIVYHVYAPVSLWLVGLYYQESITSFRKYKIGHLIGMMGLLVAILNVRFFQNLSAFNSNFILFFGLCIIGMCLYSFIYIINNEERKLTEIRLFWVSLIFLIFWCSTYLIFALVDILVLTAEPKGLTVVYTLLWLVNLLQYAGLGVLFFIPEPKIKLLHG